MSTNKPITRDAAASGRAARVEAFLKAINADLPRLPYIPEQGVRDKPGQPVTASSPARA